MRNSTRRDTAEKFGFVSMNGVADGGIDVKSVDDEISALTERGSRNFVFELKDIEYLDGAAAGIIINTLCYSQKESGSVFIIARGEKTRGVLEMTGFHHFIKIFGSEDDFWNARG